MKKGNIYTGKVESVSFPDRGLVVGEEGRAHVKECIEGQKISFKVKRKRDGISEGEFVELLEKSPLETETPKCPHFGTCGSCKLQTLPYETQAARKEAQIRKLLDEAIAGSNGIMPHDSGDCSGETGFYEWQGILKSPAAFEYRNKMEFSFGNAYKNGPLTLGLHRKNSFYDVIDVPSCYLIDGDVRAVTATVLELCREREYDFFHKMSHEGYLRHLLVRKTYYTNELMVVLVTSGNAPSDEPDFLEMLVKRLCALKKAPDAILHTINNSLADVISNDGTTLLFGRDYIEEKLLGLTFKISPFSFFQTNSRGAEVLYDKAREYVGETRDKIIFDLYSGTGTIAQLLAPVAKKVIGVEIIPEAVDAARENAKLNGLSNCSFIADDVLRALDEITEKPDFIVLDPPRDGVNPKALTKILAYGVDNILYISCKATSLARDLAPMQMAGYRVKKAACVDLFPQTGHVETCVLLSRETYRHPDARVKIDIDLDDYYRIKEGEVSK